MLFLLAGVVIIFTPLIWTIALALKPDAELFSEAFFPRNPAWGNFARSVQRIPFFLYLWNTATIVIPVVIGTTFSAAIVAYGFSRFQFKGKRTLFLILLATMMLPGQVTLIPTFLMFREFGWTNTILPLVVPSFFGGGAFNIFLVRQFIGGIPLDFDEAAVIDGASRFKIFVRIVLPLMRPVLTTVSVFTFMGVWNDFNGPLIYLTDPSRYTLALGISFFRGMFATQWNLLMAATLLIMLPVIIIFFIAQRYIIEGIAISSGTKG
jgi:multiple sugar transport system permease protein